MAPFLSAFSSSRQTRQSASSAQGVWMPYRNTSASRSGGSSLLSRALIGYRWVLQMKSIVLEKLTTAVIYLHWYFLECARRDIWSVDQSISSSFL
jgi:hypothetical protein